MRDKASAIGKDTHTPVRPNKRGKIRRPGSRKIIWRADASTRDGNPRPIPWKKKLSTIWIPMLKKAMENMRRAELPSSKNSASVLNSDITCVENIITIVQHTGSYIIGIIAAHSGKKRVIISLSNRYGVTLILI